MGVEEQLLVKKKEEMKSSSLCKKDDDDVVLVEEKSEEDKDEACSTIRGLGLGFPQRNQLVVVGYALTSKKIKSFLQPKLESLARNKGILFVPIDVSKPLHNQGPFDIVLHKLTGKEWRQILESSFSIIHHES